MTGKLAFRNVFTLPLQTHSATIACCHYLKISPLRYPPPYNILRYTFSLNQLDYLALLNKMLEKR